MTLYDWLALGLFVLCWFAHGPLMSLLTKRSGTLTDDMQVIRRVWMTAMSHREIRLVDANLIGHTIHSVGFFASTNLLLIAAVGSVLFGGEQAMQGIAAAGVGPTPTRLLEIKLALILACLARGLLDFIWSIRQMNYSLAVIGAAPEMHTEADRAALGVAATDLLNPALSSFSRGVRGYYFALAAAAWLFGPLWLALGVIAAFCLLTWRQIGSPAALAIRNARRVLDHDAR